MVCIWGKIFWYFLVYNCVCVVLRFCFFLIFSLRRCVCVLVGVWRWSLVGIWFFVSDLCMCNVFFCLILLNYCLLIFFSSFIFIDIIEFMMWSLVVWDFRERKWDWLWNFILMCVYLRCVILGNLFFYFGDNDFYFVYLVKLLWGLNKVMNRC